MIRWALRGLSARPARSVALAAGLVVASVTFSLLTAAASTTTARVQHTVGSNFRAAYDILVRPAGSTTGLERSAGLVEANYLSGIFGGISLAQWHQVEKIPGVDVAAPIAMVGYVMPGVFIPPVDLQPYVGSADREVFKIETTSTAENGLSVFAHSPSFVYVTRNRFVEVPNVGLEEEAPDLSGPQSTCGNFDTHLPAPATDPFAPSTQTSLNCWSMAGGAPSENGSQGSSAGVAAQVAVTFPFVLAAIDPAQEAKLVGLDHTVVKGRYLAEGDFPQVLSGAGKVSQRVIPVIAASQPFTGDSLTLKVQRLDLASSQVASDLLGSDPFAALNSASATTVQSTELGPGQLYQSFLSASANGVENTIQSYWAASSVDYTTEGPSRLAAVAVSNPASVWSGTESQFVFVPPDNADVAFRHLDEFIGSNLVEGGVADQAGLSIVGTFDASRLPGFNPLTAVPLSTYNPPTATGADARSRSLLGDRSLIPDENLAGYLQSPPLLLTTLSSLPALSNPSWYSGANSSAPISVIRVRVGGLHGSVRGQLARISRVAIKIKNTTGLQVDVTAGASPTDVTVDVPAGRFGRPHLALSEGWVKKGVAVAILHAVDTKSAALFGLILLVTICFFANAAFASVRARRREIGVLRCLGWPRRSIASLILGELLVIGALAGLVGTGTSFALVEGLSLHIPLWHVGLVTPVAVIITALSGAAPAWWASRRQPIDSVTPAVSDNAITRPLRTLTSLGVSNLIRMPGRAAVAALAVAVGVGALTVLISISLTFTDSVGGSALGGVINSQVRGVDYLSAALAILLAAASVADVLFLNLRERAPERGMLAAAGWRRVHLATVAIVEGTGIGVAGSITGAAAAVAIIAGLGALSAPVVAAAAIAMAGGSVVVLLAVIGVVSAVDQMPLAAALADE